MAEGPLPVNSALKRWSVTTPEMVMYRGGYDPPEPDEYGCHYAVVDAATAREAKWLAIKQFRAQTCCEGEHFRCRMWDPEDRHPLAGLMAVVMEPCARHGFDYENCEPVECYEVRCVVCEKPLDRDALDYAPWGDPKHRECAAGPLS